MSIDVCRGLRISPLRINIWLSFSQADLGPRSAQELFSSFSWKVRNLKKKSAHRERYINLMAGIFEIQTFFWQHRVSIVIGLMRYRYVNLALARCGSTRWSATALCVGSSCLTIYAVAEVGSMISTGGYFDSVAQPKSRFRQRSGALPTPQKKNFQRHRQQQ